MMNDLKKDDLDQLSGELKYLNRIFCNGAK